MYPIPSLFSLYIHSPEINSPAPATGKRPKSKTMAEMENPEVMKKMISSVSMILERVCESNEVEEKSGSCCRETTSVFDGRTKAPISIGSYLERIFKYANCSPSCLIVAYIYLDRFSVKQPQLPITPLNVHRFIISSVMVSAKFMDDIFFNNAMYTKIGGISSVMEMNVLEVDFLFGLKFELNVTPSVFSTYCSCLQREMLVQFPPLRPSIPDKTREELRRRLQEDLAVV